MRSLLPAAGKAVDAAQDPWAGERDAQSAAAQVRQTAMRVASHGRFLALWVAICLTLAVAYYRHTSSDYIAAVRFVLQSAREVQDGPHQDDDVQQIGLDRARADTELGVLRSERLLRAVFTRMDLAASPELQSDGNGVWLGLSNLAHRLFTDTTAVDPAALAFGRFSDRVRTRRLGFSYVIEVSYRSSDPVAAARIANALASTYLSDRIALILAGSRIGVPYLQDRIKQLEGEFMEAGQAALNGTAPTRYLPDAEVRMLGPATVPLGKVFPKAGPMALIATALGVISGLTLIGLWLSVDTTIRSREDLLGADRLTCPIVVRRAHGLRRTPAHPDGYTTALVEQLASSFGALGVTACPGARAAQSEAASAWLGAMATGIAGATKGSPDPGPVGRDRFQARPLPEMEQAGTYLGGVVLVVEAGRTTMAELQSALRQIGLTGLPVAALLLQVSATSSRLRFRL